MSGLKKFLDKRAKGLAKEEALKNGEELIPTKTEYKTILDHDLGYVIEENEVEIEEESIDLNDDEFWDISNEFNKEMKISKDDPSSVLQKILERYTSLKIEQFAKRYQELNS